MLVATIYDGETPAGRIWLEGGVVRADTEVAKKTAAKPIFFGERRFTSADGEEFLRILPHVYRNNGYGGVELTEEQDAQPNR